ncbi:MAG: hypothetical protein ACFB10_07350 [Salibacteraceae bacterium]
MIKKLSLLPVMVLFVGLLVSLSTEAQIVLENKTNCDYKVKVNTLPHGVCHVNGAGPVYIVPAGTTIVVPSPPPHLWVPAFGFNEVVAMVLPPFIVGDPGCGVYPAIFGPYGSCVSTAVYMNPHHLLIY